MGKKGTLSNKILRIVGIVVLLGLVLAVFQKFNFDPFGVIDWLISWGFKILDTVAGWFSSKEGFQEITNKPS